jgi:hypothetical protein
VVFGQVLAVLDAEGLIGREMFAIDGVKLPSNASKHRSGTRAEFAERAEKLERKAKAMLHRHRDNDRAGVQGPSSATVAARIQRMQLRATELREWLATHPRDRHGPTGGVRKSNLTDNESAKMATDKGVIQGYCGVAAVDSKQQVIVEASAYGSGSEQELLLPVIDACRAQRCAGTEITADAGYHSEDNLRGLAERSINALIADNGMRQRDERFAEQARHRDKRLYRNGRDCTIGSYRAIKFRAPQSACTDCTLRATCLRKPEVSRSRQVAILVRKHFASHSQRMRERIDNPAGRERYGRRFATVEPVFANLRHNKRLTRFTLRGQRKVDGQWKLFALVHNIEKLANHRKAA